MKKNRGFVDSEFVKTCHEHVNGHERTLILLNNAISAFAKKKGNTFLQTQKRASGIVNNATY